MLCTAQVQGSLSEDYCTKCIASMATFGYGWSRSAQTSVGIQEKHGDYYDIMIIGRTGMGKSTTCDKLIIANPTGDSETSTVKEGRMDTSDLTIWLISNAEGDIARIQARLKNLVLFRELLDPHKEVNEFHCDMWQSEETALKYQLISRETTKLRVLIVELPTTAPNKATSKGVNIMREVLRIQAAIGINFKRILYFIPQRGPLERPSPAVQMELEIMMQYFGKSIFDCMVLVTTLPPDVHEYLPPDVILFSKINEVMTQKNFQISLSHILPPGEHLPDCKPPIVFISMNDTCEDIVAKIKSAPVIFDGIRFAFKYGECVRCGIKTQYLEEGAKKVMVACYCGGDPSRSIPYEESLCHPMIVSKYRTVTKILGGISHAITRKKYLGFWPNFHNPDDEMCVDCRQNLGAYGCTRVNTYYKTRGYTLIVDHCYEPIVHVTDEHMPNIIQFEKGTQIPFLQQKILKCDHNGLKYPMKDYGMTLIVPQGSVVVGEEIQIEVGITLYGPFNFPQSTRPISPILSLRLLEENTLMRSFQVALCHILGELTELKTQHHRVHFCYSEHFRSHDPTYTFHPLNSDDVDQSFKHSYGLITLNKFGILCITAADTRELQSEIGYRLTRVMSTSELKNEAYLCLSYDLQAYLQAVKGQFPEEDGYLLNTSSRLTFTDFPARIQFIPEDNDSCTIAMDAVEIRVSDVDITAKTLDANTYPPRVKITVYMKDNVDVVRVQIKVKGSASDEQLHTDLSFPFKEFIEEEKHMAAIQKAMEERGRLEHTIVHGVFVGPARSGKNSLMERLLGQMPSSLSPSTGVAESTVQVKVIQKSTTVAANVEESIWSVMDYDDEAIKLLCISNSSLIRSRDEFSIVSQLMKQRSRLHTDHQDKSVAIALPEEEMVVNDSTPKISKVEKPGPVKPPNTESSLATDSQQLPASVVNQSKINYVHPNEILKSALKTKNLKSLQQYFQKNWSLYLTNTGGQMEFQEVLPLLVSGPSVFFFTFRLDRNLTEYYDIEYQLSDGTKSKPYMSTLTTIEGILQTLASISAMGTFVYRGLQKREDPLRPKVFFVGTHKDNIDRAILDSHIAKVDQQLLDVIQPTSHYESIVEFASPTQLIFTVDNFSESDSDFQKIRTAVERVVVRDEFQMTCPAHWLIYSLALRHVQSRVVSYDHCLEIAKQCGINDKKELSEALHFIHSKMGLIRYFPYEGTKDIVVVDTQFLFDKVTDLIVNTFTFEKSRKQQMDEFKQKGIFSITEFERINARSKSEISSYHFRKLLESLRIAAPFKMSGERKLFFPCVLAHTSKAKKKQIVPAADTKTVRPPLMVSFECGYCPKGVTGALIKYLMAELASPWTLNTEAIYKDQISFHVGLCDTVVINIWPTHFEVNCIRDPQFTDENGEYPIKETCSEVREAIDVGIKRILIDMNYVNSQHSLTFPCKAPGCKGSHPAVLLSRGDRYSLRCNRVGKTFKIPSSLYDWGIGKKPQEHIASTTSEEQCTTLTSQHHTILLEQLTEHSARWKSIGLQLGFRQSKLDTIEARPSLWVGAPNTMLSAVLTEWLQWAPGDGRGSTSFATIEGLKNALMKANLGATAHNLHISPS